MVRSFIRVYRQTRSSRRVGPPGLRDCRLTAQGSQRAESGLDLTLGPGHTGPHVPNDVTDVTHMRVS